jgi:hypothetical protein
MVFDELDDLHVDPPAPADGITDPPARVSDFEGDDDPPAPLADTAPTDTPSDPAGDPPADPAQKLTGIERYLSQFDIEGGMITFDDGQSKHFTELDEDQQAEVLSHLHTTSTVALEEKYGLDENEISLINYLRQNNKTIDDVVTDLAMQRVNAILALQSTESVDYDKMDNDAIYMAFLKQSNPEATVEQLEKDLATAKQMSAYDKSVASIKDGFKRTQQDAIEAAKVERRKEAEAELESQRKTVVTAVSQLKELDGFQLDDSMKNSVLDIILSVDEDGDSRFMTEVFSDPNKLFKAAWWYINGADLMQQRETYWKKEKSEAFKRGQGTPPGKQTFSGDTAKAKDKTTPPARGSGDSIASLDEIYD